MRRKRRPRAAEEVTLNLAAMLDMAFQLLAFFILTFRPSPVEGHLQLHMPPPVALTNVKSEVQSTDDAADISDDSEWKTLHLFILATDEGQVSSIAVELPTQTIIQGELSPVALRSLNKHLKSMFEGDTIVFDRVQLAVDGRLHYAELMKVVDVCTKQVLPNGEPVTRVNFVDLPVGQ